MEIALPESASTGYRWELADLPRGLTLVDDDHELAGEAPPGASGLRVFQLRVDASGVVSAHMRRSWESDAAIQTFSVWLGTSER